MAQTSICLNMIVRNEMTNLPRCLASVAPFIGSWAIVDTGSNDGSQGFIQDYFASRNIPGSLGQAPFVHFEQARNAALDHAARSGLDYDYLLVMDADMEFVLGEVGFPANMDAPAYSLQQRSHALAYWNTRLLHRTCGARYVGVTHEYISGVKPERLHAPFFIDHATGSNRIDKFQRDIRLLLEALALEPDNARHQFYLAQSYKDAGQLELAVEAYGRRVTLGGWDEEVWNAQLQKARCLLALGDDAGFVTEALKAYDMRPHRAEPLHDLARHYRLQSRHNAAVLFAEKALSIPFPQNDLLFVETATYEHGALEELSISAFYDADPAVKARGARACAALAIGQHVSAAASALACTNLFYYCKPLVALAPSFSDQQLAFTSADGYAAMNPSIARSGDDMFVNIRTVNYHYDDTGAARAPDGIVRTRNVLARLSPDLRVETHHDIAPPDDFPGGKSDIRGFEDMRLFHWRGELWSTSTVRDRTEAAWCEMVLARIKLQDDRAIMTDWRVLALDGPQVHEKNWMPCVDGDELRFVHHCAPTQILDARAHVIARHPTLLRDEALRGGSQLVAFEDGWLCLVHSVGWLDGQRVYYHWFVWFNRAFALTRVSEPFYLCRKGIEFVAGLAWMPDGRRLAVSYGVQDSEARLATVEATEVAALLAEIPDSLRDLLR